MNLYIRNLKEKNTLKKRWGNNRCAFKEKLFYFHLIKVTVTQRNPIGLNLKWKVVEL